MANVWMWHGLLKSVVKAEGLHVHMCTLCLRNLELSYAQSRNSHMSVSFEV